MREGDEDSGLAYAFANDPKYLYIMLSPHTKSVKDELAGSYGQNFTIWLDSSAGKGKILGFRLPAPESQWSRAAQQVELVGLDTAAFTASSDTEAAEIDVGPVQQRGILEARIPLSYFFGAVLPEKISVGIETSLVREAPPHTGKTSNTWQEGGSQGEGSDPGSTGLSMKRGGRRGGGRQRSKVKQDEDLTPLALWIRVTLASPPKTVNK